jgi:beta-glucosidase
MAGALLLTCWGSAASSAPPPPGLLTPLEQKRHDSFVEAGRAGDVDMLFIGDSSMDFWRYDWAGKSVWDKYYSGRRIANFGVEGAHTNSVLWRLRNGELEGFKARVVVIEGLFSGDIAPHNHALSDVLAGNAAIVAEVRRRQPQARILLVVIPRAPASDAALGTYAAAVAREFAGLADGKKVFYLDMTHALVTPHGGLDDAYLARRGSALNAAGYAVWAGAMNPRLAELAR